LKYDEVLRLAGLLAQTGDGFWPVLTLDCVYSNSK